IHLNAGSSTRTHVTHTYMKSARVGPAEVICLCQIIKKETRWITRWPECVIPQTHANERRRRSGHRIGSTQLRLNCRHVHYIPSSFDSLDAELKCAVAYGITRGHSICKKPRSSGWDRTRDWERNRIYCDLACGWNLISERLHLRVRRREYKSAGKNCRIRWLY